eukprot:UN26811
MTVHGLVDAGYSFSDSEASILYLDSDDHAEELVNSTEIEDNDSSTGVIRLYGDLAFENSLVRASSTSDDESTYSGSGNTREDADDELSNDDSERSFNVALESQSDEEDDAVYFSEFLDYIANHGFSNEDDMLFSRYAFAMDQFLERNDETELRRPPAAKSVIESLPLIEMTKKLLKDGKECAVCQEGFEVAEKGVTQIACKHYFHKKCITPWLETNNTCPLCRYELKTDSQRYE